MIKRLDEEDELILEQRRQREADALEARQRQLVAKLASEKRHLSNTSAVPIVAVKRKRLITDPNRTNTTDDPATEASHINLEKNDSIKQNNLASLLGGYGSDSSS
jgi:hypothetical protein